MSTSKSSRVTSSHVKAGQRTRRRNNKTKKEDEANTTFRGRSGASPRSSAGLLQRLKTRVFRTQEEEDEEEEEEDEEERD